MSQVIGRRLERSRDFESDHKGPRIAAGLGHERRESVALGGVGAPLRIHHRIDRLKRFNRIGALAARKPRRRLDRANEMADAVGRDLGELGQRRDGEHRGIRLGHEAEKKGAILQGIGCVLDFVDQRS